jgi:hypothetical protein
MLLIDYDSIQIPQNIFVALSFFFLKKLPRPLYFLKNISSQASSLVLIFLKKVVFSLTKVGKVVGTFLTCLGCFLQGFISLFIFNNRFEKI